MAKKKPVYLREWSFKTFFLGEFKRDFPLETKEEEIRKKLDVEFRHYGGGWIKDSLKRFGKVKKG